MRSAEFRLDGFAELPAVSRVQGSVQGNGQGGGFDALYRQLHGEVTRFIEQGDHAAALSPEGQWSRQRAQAVAHGLAAPVDGMSATPATEAQQQAFMDEILPLARQAGARLGVAPEVLAAQAALETGWGAKPIRQADGSPSHNLFGIKAGGGWQGEVVQAMTTEVEQGQPVARREAFRRYDGPAQSFNDLAQLISSSPRYQAAVGTGSDALAYGQALQRGGYATDPAYADKLARVAARIQERTK